MAIGLIAAFALTSCSDDDGNMSSKNVPAQVIETFESMYPDSSAKWEKDHGMLKAEFWKNGNEAEAWFETNGKWVRTETDYNAALPAPVQNYLDTNYATYVVEDVDVVETRQDKYFEIELEKRSHPDVTLLIREDGSLVTTPNKP